MKQWHVYEDWTLEEESRCFYVGKGNDDRIISTKRNRYHAEIIAQYGHHRRIVFSTISEEEALESERRLIAERHTHPRDPRYNGVGCNRTLGGQGNSGRIVTVETCLKISTAKRGVPKSEFERRRISEGLQKPEVKKARSEARRGLKLTEEWKQHISDGLNDPGVKEQMIERVTASIRAKYRDDLDFCQRIKETRVRGEKSASPFTEEEVKQMRNEWDLIDKTIKGGRWTGRSPARQFCQHWAKMKGVSNQAVFAIVTRKSWKHV